MTTTPIDPPDLADRPDAPDLVDLAGLFDDETIPLLRRLGERPRGAGAGGRPDPVDEETRAQVWAALTGLGALAGARTPAAPATLAAHLAVADLLGRALHQSPYLDTIAAADLLAGRGGPVEAIAEEGRTVALALRERGTDRPGDPPPFRVDGATITATRDFVAFAADVDHLLVVGAGRAALVAVDQPGVRVRRRDDVARGDLYLVELAGAAIDGDVLDVADAFPAVLARARLRHAAYLVGSARAAVRLACDRLRGRNAFGEPLARSTALAHRLAALAADAEAARALVDTAVTSGVDARLGAQAALLAGDVARRAAEEVVHLHGALGMTERCDAQLFYRRAAVDAQWYGTATALRAELAATLAARC
ncbi:acyl-CoA dehydrogenase family protein [Saccharothrix longispora]|uniref:Alkylation response protein AidB-like acyl-CoA dehydrogenase n=1 Tax=Saccharothrix longispora TaxID=33920 RepID=A0ABU1PTL5_9PSEU|nr:acyl-CoA dehydrogenase family protein [Saccharothrix longispora]MDR6593990.1 alkylation response protein AidB-like acyl-CoA dehydrogenase [Saccharothrix longispora]